MAKNDHPVARRMVEDANERWSDVRHEYASTPEKLMDAIIIVNGAMWATIEDRRNSYLIITVSKKALTATVGAMMAAGAALLGYLKQWF
jgi:hypothetical protein